MGTECQKLCEKNNYITCLGSSNYKHICVCMNTDPSIIPSASTELRTKKANYAHSNGSTAHTISHHIIQSRMHKARSSSPRKK